MPTTHRCYIIVALNALVSAAVCWLTIEAFTSLHRANARTAANPDFSCGMEQSFAVVFVGLALGLCTVMALSWRAVAKGAWRTSAAIPLTVVGLSLLCVISWQ